MGYKMHLTLLVLVIAVVAGCQRAQTASPPPATKSTDTSQQLQHVNVQLGEWFVKLDPSTVKPGQVHFMIKNVGKVVHAFEIKGQGLDEKTPNVTPGQSATLLVTVAAGTYDTFCPIDGHKSEGMDAKLTVE